MMEREYIPLPFAPVEYAFMQGLDREKHNPNERRTILLQYADWLGDNDRTAREFMIRWIIKFDKWPLYRNRYGEASGYRKVPSKFSYGWYSLHQRQPEHAKLPRLVFASLFITVIVPVRKFYPSWDRALFGLEEGLTRLREALDL